MSDLYFEQLVAKKKTGKDTAIKAGLIVLTVLVAAAGLVIPLCFILAIALAVADYFIIPSLNVEYDYLYVNGEMDITKVTAQSRRKKVMTLNVQQLELMAPVNSHRMDYYNNSKMPVYDFSSGDQSHKIYAMIIPVEQKQSKVLVELDPDMYENISKYVPRRVFND